MQPIMFKDFVSRLWLPMNLEDFLLFPDSLCFCPLGRFHFFPRHNSFAINGFNYILEKSKLLFLFIFFSTGETTAIYLCCPTAVTKTSFKVAKTHKPINTSTFFFFLKKKKGWKTRNLFHKTVKV